MPKKEQRMIVELDTDMHMQRMLRFSEKHMGWHVFKAIYWSIYIFVIGAVLFNTSYAGTFNMLTFTGFGLIMLSIFVIVYGFVYAMHLRLMKKYA